MLTKFFDKTVVVRRLRTSGQTKVYTATATADTHIQNVDSKYVASLEGVSGKTYVAYFDVNEDIQEGDQLTEATTGDVYRVMATEKMGADFGLATEHLEVMLERVVN